MELFLSADYHLGHIGILKYCKRPFKTIEKHDEHIIRIHNERIKPGDMLIHVGDFCFRNAFEDYRNRLNGNIVFIKGNHDRNNSVKTHIHSLTLDWGGKRFFVVHNPEHYKTDCDANLIGHIHNAWKVRFMDNIGTKCINVGLDVWNYMPMRLSEILEKTQHICI